jgi:hypothetical protein
MQWAVIFLIPFGIIARICKSIWILIYYFQRAQPCYSDVSRISSISVSAYLRTAAAVQGQDDMGNDLLMARVELTPVLEGVVCSIFFLSPGQFLTSTSIHFSMPQISGTQLPTARVLSISKSILSNCATNHSQSRRLICLKLSEREASGK